MKKIMRSDEEKRKIVAAIQADINSGIHINNASKKHSIDAARFYKWRKHLSGAPTIIEHDGSVERAPRKYKKAAQQPFIVFGSPEELAAFAKEMQ
jgi:transposase-like protein